MLEISRMTIKQASGLICKVTGARDGDIEKICINASECKGQIMQMYQNALFNCPLRTYTKSKSVKDSPKTRAYEPCSF